MKRYYAAALLTITLLFSGCFKQDYSDCDVPNNLVLKLELKDEDGVSLFAENIQNIHAIVFDADNCYVAHTEVAKNELNQFPCVTFSVDPGEYRVVCWGNIGERTEIVGVEAGYGFEQSYVKTVSDVTGCNLYYAPKKDPVDRDEPIIARSGGADGNIDYAAYSVTVVPNKVTTKEVEFGRAHRTVRVYLRGYEVVHESTAPTVKMDNMPVGYDFFLRTDPARKSYRSVASGISTEDGAMLLSAFNAPISSFGDDMTISVMRDSDGQTVAAVNLKQYVDENASKITDINDFGIQFRFTMGGAVEITFPSWEGEDINPEW